MGILFYKDEEGIIRNRGGKIVGAIIAIPLFIVFATAMLFMGLVDAIGRGLSKLFFGSKGC